MTLTRHFSLVEIFENFKIEDIKDFEFKDLSWDLKMSKAGINEKVASILRFAEKNFPILTSEQKSNYLSRESLAKGDDRFRSKHFEEAFKYYNIAIGAAESSSDELYIAIEKRSALNFDLGRFKDVIIDVERVLGVKNLNDIKYKLFERKAKCLIHLENYSAATTAYMEALKCKNNLRGVRKKEWIDRIERGIAAIKNKSDVAKEDISIELTDPPSEVIYCSSEAVEVAFTPKKGRMVVATKDIQIGNVLAIEKAYASDLFEEYFLNFCYECKKECFSMIPCLTCTKVFYCNEDCRRRSWNTEHMIECKIMPTLNNLEVSVVLKVLLKMTKQGCKLKKFIDKQEKYLGSSFPFRGFKNGKYSANNTSIMNLCYNYLNWVCEDLMILHACVMVLALKRTSFFGCVERRSPIFVTVARIVMKMIIQRRWNSFPLGEDLKIFGSAILPFLSLMNHSCDANSAAVRLQDDKFMLIATKPIEKGEEINISYGHRILLKESNRETFLGFRCQCLGCEETRTSVLEI